MNKFLCIAALALASSSAQALNIKTVINNSQSDAFIIAYTTPDAEHGALDKTVTRFEEALYPVESTVYMLTRESRHKKAAASSGLFISEDKHVVVSTSKGYTNLTLNTKTFERIDVIDALIITADGIVKIIQDGVAI